ncbi:MAG TPA: TIGR03435 family protein [Bryobacteraceae bacterium]|nr:TIGR03435 family protein [Bryobacteraceae bacterium]
MKLAVLAAVTALTALAQPRQPRFEVASVKAQKWTLPATVGITVKGGTLDAEHQPLYDLIVYSCNLKGRFQISGIPDWAEDRGISETASFQIQAKAAPGQNPTEDELRLMMQALLADRFHLKIHHESRNMPVYYLTIGKGGSKLRETSGGNTGIKQDKVGRVGWRLRATNVTIQSAVDGLLGIYSGRPLLNKTGLTGSYDFTLEWLLYPLPPDASVPGADLPSFPAALQEQLGLKLKSATAPYDTIVIDRVERPSEN